MVVRERAGRVWWGSVCLGSVPSLLAGRRGARCWDPLVRVLFLVFLAQRVRWGLELLVGW